MNTLLKSTLPAPRDGVGLILGMVDASENERCKERAKKHEKWAGQWSPERLARTDAICFGQHEASASQTATPQVQRQVVWWPDAVPPSRVKHTEHRCCGCRCPLMVGGQ